MVLLILRLFAMAVPAGLVTAEPMSAEVLPENTAPVLEPIGDQSVRESDTLEVVVRASDSDGDSLTLSVGNLPPFGGFTDNGDGTGSIEFWPGMCDSGLYPGIKVVATDDGTPPQMDTETFTLIVLDFDRPPQVGPIPDQRMDEGTTLDVPVSAVDPDVAQCGDDHITLSVRNLPPFGSFTDNGDGTGTLHFAPDSFDAGEYRNILVVATDNAGMEDTQAFVLTVNDVDEDCPGNRAGTDRGGLQVRSISVTAAVVRPDALKKEGRQADFVILDFPMDAYTAPTWASSTPSVFSVEEYTFGGGSLATVDHRTVFNNNATPATPLAILFAWQPCGCDVIFPPTPAMVGACPSGLFLTLPSSGIWYITVGISGFPAGTSWDWVWVTDTSGATCISVPDGVLAGDIHGGDNNAGSFRLYGGGDSGSRPLCFMVTP